MRVLHLRKIATLLLLLAFLVPARAQFNIHELGRKQIYFGIALAANVADYKIQKKPFAPENDSIKSFRPTMGAGFNLGIIANWQFHRNFDLRLIPSLIFSDRSIEYTTVNKKQSVVKQTVSSIYLDFPLQLRFKSEPIKDFRVYVIAGMRYDLDLASNSNSRIKSLLKVGKHDVSAEYGVGMMFYFPYFILSPEFKMSHGIININTPNESYIYSRVIDKLYSRSFTFTINLEG
ncbi:MAG: outer membrane beta-barrel protein [Chitinophagales bacterium]